MTICSGNMMSYDFQTTTHGKWILAGEHAVLRGSAALVYPDHAHALCLTYRKNKTFNIKASGVSGELMSKLFWQVLAKGWLNFGSSLEQIPGEFHIDCDIPIGVGLGSSAAICVAAARWFAAQGYILPKEIASNARDLENIFHGVSSGLDIAGVMAQSGVYFHHGKATEITQTWQPNLRLSSCDYIGTTAKCIVKVQQLWKSNQILAETIDHQMQQAVETAKGALSMDTPTSKQDLADAINQAANCFEQWGLINNSLQEHMKTLRKDGALAVKPTGSGGGGFVISLWE